MKHKYDFKGFSKLDIYGNTDEISGSLQQDTPDLVAVVSSLYACF